MKIFKYIRNILLDIIKIVIGIAGLLLILGIAGAVAFGILLVIAGTSALVSKMLGGNEIVLYGCMLFYGK